MTVRELIEKLESVDTEKDVEIYVCGRLSGVLDISQIEEEDTTVFLWTVKA